MADAELIAFRAEMSAWKGDIAKMTGQTEVEVGKQLKAWERMWKANEAAAKRSFRRSGAAATNFGAAAGAAATASRNFGTGLSSIAMQLPDVASQLASGTPVLQVFTQQGLQVAQMNMSSLMTMMARFGPAAGVVGAAVAALGVTYVLLARQVEEAEAKQAEMAAMATRAQTAYDSFQGAIAAVEIELARTVGTYDELGAAQKLRDSAITRGAKLEREAADALVTRAEAQRQAAVTMEQTRTAEERLAQVTVVRDRAMFGIAEREEAALTRSGQIAEYMRERAESEDTLRDRAERRARAEKAAAAADREVIARTREREAAVTSLAGIQASAELSVLEGEARITEEYARQIERIRELEAVSGDRAAAEAAQIAVTTEMEAALHEERMKQAAQAADNLARESAIAAADAQAAAQAAQRQQDQIYSSSQALATNTEALLASATEAAIAAGGRGARALWALQVVATTAKIGAFAAEGYAQAAALLPPANAIQALAVTAGIGASLATLAASAPTFADTPGVMSAGSRGMSATFAPGDKIIAGRDESDLVRQMQEAGIGMGGGAQVLVRDADRHHGRYGRDPMRPPDRYDPIRRRAGRTPGRV